MTAVRLTGLGKHRKKSYMPVTNLNMMAWTCFSKLFIKIWNHFKREWYFILIFWICSNRVHL